jgi:transcriptional regulator with XRE-family HTH domain
MTATRHHRPRKGAGAPRRRPTCRLGRRIDAWLDLRGLTLAEGAAEIGVHEQTLRSWRFGRAPMPLALDVLESLLQDADV